MRIIQVAFFFANKQQRQSGCHAKIQPARLYFGAPLPAQSSSDTRYYIYDGIHCIAEYEGSNGFIKEYIYGHEIDEVLCSIDMFSTAQYYHQDALQSVVAVTDGFRNKIASYEYDVYGKIINKTGSLENEITFTGRWLEEDTGLYYYRARWYDADVGRFISRDPIGVNGGINLYGYVGNGPVNFGDPKGLMKCGPCEEEYFDRIVFAKCMFKELSGISWTEIGAIIGTGLTKYGRSLGKRMVKLLGSRIAKRLGPKVVPGIGVAILVIQTTNSTLKCYNEALKCRPVAQKVEL